MSESAQSAASAPVVSAPAVASETSSGQAAPPVEMGETQQAALKEVARLRGEYSNTPAEQRDALARKITNLQKFAFGNGEKPADFMPGDLQPSDNRPADSLRDTLEAAGAEPIDVEAMASDYSIRGLHPELAREFLAVADVCGAGAVQTRNIMGRALEHLGPSPDRSRADDITPLEAKEFQEHFDSAARSFRGGAEELQAKSDRARRWLATKSGPTGKNVLEVLDKHGYTSTSLACDPGLIVTLCALAERDGVK